MYNVVTSYTNRSKSVRKGMTYKAAVTFATKRIESPNVKSVTFEPVE